jgi:hypothetical protein
MEGFTRLLSVALQISGVARAHIRALKVAGEDFSEVIPTIDDISWQMVQPGPGKIN